MKHRKLRIAWSVAWGVMAVLLCVLWVRSYWRADYILGIAPMDRFFVASDSGFFCLDNLARDEILKWKAIFEIEVWEYVSDKPTSQQQRLSPWTPHYFRAESGLHILPTGAATGARRQLFFPICYVVVLSTVVGLAPWMHWSKRFSLRTLLIATTLVAVLLGIFAYNVRG